MYKIKQFFTRNINFSGHYELLSPHYYSDIVYEGMKYPTAWHAYQASRCLDYIDKKAISSAQTNEEIEAIIKAAERGYRTKVWDTQLKDMKAVQKKKFTKKFLKRFLLNTYPAKLVFTNKDHEHFWGSCSKHLFAKGNNALGKMLMEIRDELLDEGNGAVRR